VSYFIKDCVGYVGKLDIYNFIIVLCSCHNIIVLMEREFCISVDSIVYISCILTTL